MDSAPEPAQQLTTLPLGTHVVTRVPSQGAAGGSRPVGMVGVMVAAPDAAEPRYRVRFADGDGAEALPARRDLTIRKGVPRQGLRDAVASAVASAVDPLLDTFVILRCVVGSRAYGLDGPDSDGDPAWRDALGGGGCLASPAACRVRRGPSRHPPARPPGLPAGRHLPAPSPMQHGHGVEEMATKSETTLCAGQQTCRGIGDGRGIHQYRLDAGREVAALGSWLNLNPIGSGLRHRHSLGRGCHTAEERHTAQQCQHPILAPGKYPDRAILCHKGMSRIGRREQEGLEGGACVRRSPLEGGQQRDARVGMHPHGAAVPVLRVPQDAVD